jgi:hypothetical protein
MKLLPSLCLVLGLAGCATAQETPIATPNSTAPVAGSAQKRTTAELEKLVAPIALYPDALVALILPASTASAEVVLASRYLETNGDSASVDDQPWDDSVKGLARYPSLLKWMDQNLEWTRQLGAAFLIQPADVMNTVQRLRADARQAGLLTDTSQQKVVEQDGEILIVPAAPDVIYVPYYDPQTLYLRRRYYGSRPFISFSAGFAVGSWLYYDCDWHRRVVWVHHRTPHWSYRPDWRVHHHHSSSHRTVIVGDPWRPDPRRTHGSHRGHPPGRTATVTTTPESYERPSPQHRRPPIPSNSPRSGVPPHWTEGSSRDRSLTPPPSNPTISAPVQGVAPLESRESPSRGRDSSRSTSHRSYRSDERMAPPIETRVPDRPAMPPTSRTERRSETRPAPPPPAPAASPEPAPAPAPQPEARETAPAPPPWSNRASPGRGRGER